MKTVSLHRPWSLPPEAFLPSVALTFAMLKTGGWIDWSWTTVTAPVWMPLVGMAGAIVQGLLAVYLALVLPRQLQGFKEWWQRQLIFI